MCKSRADAQLLKSLLLTSNCISLLVRHAGTIRLAGIHPSRIANWESKGVDAIEADLKYGDGIRYVGGPPGTKEQAWRWVNYVRAQNQNTPPRPEPEILTLKPGFARGQSGFEGSLPASTQMVARSKVTEHRQRRALPFDRFEICAPLGLSAR